MSKLEISFSRLLSVTIVLTSFLSIKNSQVLAQVIPDQSLGNESTVVLPLSEVLQLIQNGAIRDENLFHSFKEFNINEGENIVLTNPDGVNHILIRVTGDNPSHLFGNLSLIKAETINNLLSNLSNLSQENFSDLITIQDIGTADVFFLNPNGVLFGKNATLNLGGSFIATTANQIKFSDGTIFSADLSESSPLLTINTPIGLQFSQPHAQPITVQENFRSLTSLLSSVNDETDPSDLIPQVLMELEERAINDGKLIGLNVFSQKTLALVGGDINLEGGVLTALGGRIELGSLVHGGNVSLTPIENGWSLGYEEVAKSARGEINLSQLALINPDLFSSGGGEVQIRGQKVNLVDESAIISLTFSNQDTRDISIQAEEINLTNGSIISAGTSDLDGRIIVDESGQLILLSNIVGNSGDILIETQNLTAKDSSFIGNISIFSQGASGDLIVKATNDINIDNSIIWNINFSETQAGKIFFQTDNLNVINGGFISTITVIGEGGDITIDASESIHLQTVDFDNENPVLSLIISDTINRGDAGDITITTKNLSLGNGGRITADTEGTTGKGGDLKINAFDFIELNGSALISTRALVGSGNGGNINIKTLDLTIRNGGEISGETTNDGDSGFIEINADSLRLENQGNINVRSNAQGDSGNITLNIGNLFRATDSNVTTSSDRSSGGEIKIRAGDIRLLGNSDITTNVNSGIGGGGNITLTADSILAFNDSDILAFARDGQGGDIRLDSDVFFGDGYELSSSPNNLDGNGRVDINATGAIDGAIILPDLTFIQNSLLQLPENLINPESLIVNSCVVPNPSQGGTFIITGSGNFPTRPGESNISPYPTGGVEPIPSETETQSWRRGEPIVEAEGVYQSSEGKLVLSRECR